MAVVVASALFASIFFSTNKLKLMRKGIPKITISRSMTIIPPILKKIFRFARLLFEFFIRDRIVVYVVGC